MPAHRKHLTKQEKTFKDDGALLDFALRTLVDSGLTVEQVTRLRERQRGRGTGVFDKETTNLRRYITSELLAAGLSNAQIAKVLKQSKETVNADRHHIRQIYVDKIMATADQWRARLIDEQEALKVKALESFEASKRKTIRKVTEKQGAEMVTMEEHCSAGESSFLTVAKGCLSEQARLLGLYDRKPEQQDDDKSYKKFLSNLSQEVKKIRDAESNAKDRAEAINTEAEAEFDDNGEPTGASKPMLPANDEESPEELDN